MLAAWLELAQIQSAVADDWRGGWMSRRFEARKAVRAVIITAKLCLSVVDGLAA
jgi:hypothetical protein